MTICIVCGKKLTQSKHAKKLGEFFFHGTCLEKHMSIRGYLSSIPHMIPTAQTLMLRSSDSKLIAKLCTNSLERFKSIAKSELSAVELLLTTHMERHGADTPLRNQDKRHILGILDTLGKRIDEQVALLESVEEHLE